MRGLIVAVGTSPVHVLRMILSLPPGRFDNIILRTTEITSEYGHRILDIVNSEGHEAEVVGSMELGGCLGALGDDWEFDLILGPGRKQDVMAILGSVIGATGEIPRFWVSFGERTKRGNAKQGEYTRLLRRSTNDPDESHALPNIDIDTACRLYDIDTTYFDKSWLEWNPSTCQVLLKAEDPDRPTELLEAIEAQKNKRNSRARAADKEIAREWESRWLGEASETRGRFGLHAVIASHPQLPSAPGHWLSTKDRMKHHNFRGGSK
jgi:hypothetical protein